MRANDDIFICFIPFYAMTACDTNSCVHGHEKLSLYEKNAKSSEARSLLLKGGKAFELNCVQDFI